ncbi:MAG: protein kinase [Gemmatales bacterium]|nr:protein kinase [Gemmatales bacterium]MCS7158831.1 protein kinase [Gemmatales bacterium]MDW8174030.1 protein kinase [Gemmatales bacterium]MDW8223155.1 protein kinase [Gemmatales bacterium]
MSEQTARFGFSAVVDELRRRYGWKLNEELGRGGFAIVYREEVDGLPRAVKISLDSLQSDHPAVQRQLEALQLLLSLGNHPQLLTLIRYEVLLGHLVTIWELADQGTLWELLQAWQEAGSAGLPLDDLLAYMEQAAEGIDFLNTRGVYHRDIKPQNLFLVGGQVKVGDLGLLKLTGLSTASHTGTGTHGYLPPEAYGTEGQPGRLHRSIDVYSLAATYVHLRTGKAPFGTSPCEINHRQSRGEPIADGLSPAELDWLRRALAPDPERRPLSAGAFVNELIRRLADAVPVVHALTVDDLPCVECVPSMSQHRETSSATDTSLPPLSRSLQSLQHRYLALGEAIHQARRGTHPELTSAWERYNSAKNEAEELRLRIEKAPLPAGVTPKLRDMIWQRLLHNPDQPPSAFLCLLPDQKATWQFLQWLTAMKQAALASRPLTQAERALRVQKDRLLRQLRAQQSDVWQRLDWAQRQDLKHVLRPYRRRWGRQAQALPVELWVELGPKLQSRYLGYDLQALLLRAEWAWEESSRWGQSLGSWIVFGLLTAIFGALFALLSTPLPQHLLQALGRAFFGCILGIAAVCVLAAMVSANAAAAPFASSRSGPPIARRRHRSPMVN